MPELRCCGLKAAAALAALGMALGGCSMPSLSSYFRPPPGSSPAAADSNASAAVATPANFECPSVVVRQGAGSMSISANPADPNALNLKYQLGFGDTARECHVTGPMVSMKIGISGRVIVGPAGGAGQVEVPLRFAVVQEGVEPRTITTKLQILPVTIAQNEPSAEFSYVEDAIAFPMPKGGDIDSYVVYIGFDPTGAEELEKSRRKPAPKPARPRRANTAQGPAR